MTIAGRQISEFNWEKQRMHPIAFPEGVDDFENPLFLKFSVQNFF